MKEKRRNILRVENVSFIYGKEVLRDVSFSIEEGDYLGIIGENGGGKTTLVKLILGILKPSKGKIFLCGKDIRKFRSWDEIGYIPQKATGFDQNFPSSVEEIVSLGLLSKKKIFRFITKTDRKLVAEQLEKLGMQQYSKKKIGELSGGQQQRVFIAKALVSKPRLLILDEPTAGIDPKAQGDFYEMLGNLNNEGITIIIVSHDVGYITRYVSKVACLNTEMVFHGTHDEFCRSHVVDEILGHEKHIVCHDHQNA